MTPRMGGSRLLGGCLVVVAAAVSCLVGLEVVATMTTRRRSC